MWFVINQSNSSECTDTCWTSSARLLSSKALLIVSAFTIPRFMRASYLMFMGHCSGVGSCLFSQTRKLLCRKERSIVQRQIQ